MKFVFDENFGRPLVEALARLLALGDEDDPPEIVHILDWFKKQGAKDEKWIPPLSDGQWIVISYDLGRKPGPKLPYLCRRHRITHVLVSGTLNHASQMTRILAILSVWPKLCELSSKPAGSRFMLCKGHGDHAVLEERPLPAKRPRGR